MTVKCPKIKERVQANRPACGYGWISEHTVTCGGCGVYKQETTLAALAPRSQ